MNSSQYIEQLLFLELCGVEIGKKYDELVLVGVDDGAVDFDDVRSFLPVRVWNFASEENLVTSGKRVLYIVIGYPIAMLPDGIWSDESVVVNLYTGMSSFGYKVSPELGDVAYCLAKNKEICEVYDMHSFFNLLRLDGGRCIRFGAQYLPMELFPVFDAPETGNVPTILSLMPFGAAGDQATVLCGASALSMMLSAVALLHEKNCFVDVFALVRYGAEIRDDLKESLLRTGVLCVVIDQELSDELRRLFDFWYAKYLKKPIVFVTPEYTKLTSYLQEFRPDQALWDAKGLADCVEKEAERNV